MIIPFDCPACKAHIEAEVRGLKRRVTTCSACKEQVQVPDDLKLGPGVTIGNGYRLEQRIGESSLGEVYRAVQGPSGKQFTVEILSGDTSRDQEKVTRLMQETDLVASFKHPNIVQAIEAGQDSETYFLVTAYEPGLPLNQYLKQQGALPCDEALGIVIDIAEALKYAWEEKKVLHRDIKPHNIVVTTAGHAKLTGFGIAKSKEGTSLGLTGVGFTIGTPEYMSPEQIRAAEDLDYRSDMYALGIVLYECVVGALPFQETAPILLLQKHMDEVPEPAINRNPNVTPACSSLIERLLEKDRENRPGSWAELLEELRAVLQAPPAESAAERQLAPARSTAPAAAPLGAPAPAAAGGGGSKKLLIAACAIGALIVILLIVVAVVLSKR
jgi:serine/threonine-protein kinase